MLSGSFHEDFCFADFVKNNAAAVSRKNSTTSRKSSTSGSASAGSKANSASANTTVINGGKCNF